MRAETFKTNVACNCPSSCGHRDIEEFGNTSSDISVGLCNSPTLKRRSTSTKLPDMARLNPRSRRSTPSPLDSTTIADTTVALCTCQQSRSYPFCDNTHIAFNKETHSSLGPLFVTIVEDPNKKHSDTCDANCTVGENNIYDINKDIEQSIFLEEPPDIVDNIAESLYSSTIAGEPPSHESPCIDFTSPPDTAPTYTPSSIKDKVNRQNVFTEEEIAKHRSKDSLWMIIKGNVYDITTYVPSHPGGERALLKFAGRDGTENVQFHSSKMLEILNSRYFIGKLYMEEAPSRCTIS
jgi:cytochrome b involved in lipid metabolism/CDGSH-type Zn-finger protein